MSPGLNEIGCWRKVEGSIKALADRMFDFMDNILCARRPTFEGIKVPRRPELVQREVQ